MPVDGIAAAHTLLGWSGIKWGYCLYYVWQAYKAHGARTGRSAEYATDAWYASDGQHPGDRSPPPGVPVFWGPKPGSYAGDVVISLGGGMVAATDYPRYGVTGQCSVDDREAQIGRPYLGWTECIFDQPIAFPTPTSGGGVNPFTQEDDMQQDEREALFAIKSALLDGVPGRDLSRAGITQAIEATLDVRDRMLVKDANGTPMWDAFQELIPNVRVLLAAVGRLTAGTPASAPADIEALAGAIREGLGKELADELAKRLAS